MKSTIRIIQGDSLQLVRNMKARMIFADPPDNTGMPYKGFSDFMSAGDYKNFLRHLLVASSRCKVFWLSYAAKYQSTVLCEVEPMPHRQFIWHYTFGQQGKRDCTPSYRPLLRIWQRGVGFYPKAIRIPSARQTKYNDKRDNPKGRVPDDVWTFPRVCGTFKERRKWIPNQHPEALLERIVLLSTRKGDTVIDMFAGSGSMLRVCRRLGRNCIGIDISKYYCSQIAKELKIKKEIGQ